jgi:hypothetical protein
LLLFSIVSTESERTKRDLCGSLRVDRIRDQLAELARGAENAQRACERVAVQN